MVENGCEVISLYYHASLVTPILKYVCINFIPRFTEEYTLYVL